MNETSRKPESDGKQGKPVFRSDAPLIYKRDGYTCVRDDIWEKINRRLQNDKLGGERAHSILAELEK